MGPISYISDSKFKCPFCGKYNAKLYMEYDVLDGIIYLDRGVSIIECKDCYMSKHTPHQIRGFQFYSTYGINIIMPNWRSDYYKKVLALKADWCSLPTNIRWAVADSIPLIEKLENEDIEWSKKQLELNTLKV